MQIRAIDISYCQPIVDFNKVKKSGISAAIVRNGYLGKTDTAWYENTQKAIDAGFDVGTFTYIWSNTPAQAAREAAETVQRLERFKGSISYPVFADMEDNKYLKPGYNKNSRTEILLTFLKTIERAGYYSAVYTNPSWLENYIDKTQILGKYDIWLAAYTNSPDKPTRYNYGQVMWQWGAAPVSGIKGGPVDSDLVYIDYPERIRAAGKNYLLSTKNVELAFAATIRAKPSAGSEKLGLLKAGEKCAVTYGTETKDPATGYIYIKLGGENKWIVKTAIK